MLANDMLSKPGFKTASVVIAFVVLCVSSGTAFAEGYGSISGQFLLEGDIPEPELLVAKGDMVKGKDAACAAQDIYSESLVVDPETKGIANVFVFKRTADEIYPDLKESKEKTVVFDQKGCRFFPHALLVRTDQTVIVKSEDNCAHNTHTITLRNAPANFLLPPNDRKGQQIVLPVPETLPMEVKCDIHPWMSARWLILDHPYAAITGKDGKFTIDKLPEGEHEIRVWQERVGYLVFPHLKVTVRANETTVLPPIQVPVSKFFEQ